MSARKREIVPWLVAIGLGIALGLAALHVPSVPVASAQDAPARLPAGKKYATGRIAPKDLARLRRVKGALHGQQVKRLPQATAPSYDCRTLGLVPPIKDQGNCGSCWDFSGTGVVESALIKAGYGKPDGSFALSEQYTLDCGRNGGCNGDDNTTVLDWAKTTGLPQSSVYGSYQARSGRCQLPSGAQLYKISAWGFAGDQNGVTAVQDIKNAMVAYGPIGCAIAADDAFMNMPSGTVFDRTTSTSIDHDVILIGWDDSKGTNGAWLLRNSWGKSWCDSGYCWIGYGVNQVGTEAVWASATPPAPLPGAPVITSATTAAGVVGQPFTYQITASGTPTSFDAVGLPTGLTVSAQSGLISGTPTAPFGGVVAVTATNVQGMGSEAVTFSITTSPPPPPMPSNVTITLTQEQVASVVNQSGAIVVTKTTTLEELLTLFAKAKERVEKDCTPCQQKKK